jgi:hypothetical protein
MDRVRLRVKDKRVLALVKAFLKAGVLTEQSGLEERANVITRTHAACVTRTGIRPIASVGRA